MAAFKEIGAICRPTRESPLVVDDLQSVNHLTPRGIEVRGRADLHSDGGDKFGPGWDAAWIRIVPTRIVSWGIEAPAFSAGSRSARSDGDAS